VGNVIFALTDSFEDPLITVETPHVVSCRHLEKAEIYNKYVE